MDLLGGVDVLKQNVYRAEMDLVQAHHLLRRMKWDSLTMTTTLVLAAGARCVAVLARNVSQKAWAGVSAIVVLYAVTMYVVGDVRHKRYVPHSWDELRFAPPPNAAIR